MKAKQAAKQVAKTLAREPIEILKTAVRQVGGEPSEETRGKPAPQENKPIDEQKLKNQSVRQIQALEAEIKDIRVQKQQKEATEKREEIVVQEEKQSKLESAPPQVQSKPSRGLSFFKKKLGKNIEQRKPPSG